MQTIGVDSLLSCEVTHVCFPSLDGGVGRAAVAPDGRHVYYATVTSGISWNALAAEGLVRQDPGACDLLTACVGVRGVSTISSLVMTPDGATVIVSGSNSTGWGIASLTRDPVSGHLSQSSGVGGCVTEPVVVGCSAGRAILGAGALAVASGGNEVYVVASISSAVAVVAIAGDGTIAQLAGAAGCVGSADTPTADGCTDRPLGVLVPSALLVVGGSLYVTSIDGRLTTSYSVLTRDAVSGGLVQAGGAAGCFNEGGLDGCTAVRIPWRGELSASADGAHLLIAGGVGDGAALLIRDPQTGAVAQPTGTAGCSNAAASDGCAQSGALDGGAAEVTPGVFAVIERVYGGAPVWRLLEVGQDRLVVAGVADCAFESCVPLASPGVLAIGSRPSGFDVGGGRGFVTAEPGAFCRHDSVDHRPAAVDLAANCVSPTGDPVTLSDWTVDHGSVDTNGTYVGPSGFAGTATVTVTAVAGGVERRLEIAVSVPNDPPVCTLDRYDLTVYGSATAHLLVWCSDANLDPIAVQTTAPLGGVATFTPSTSGNGSVAGALAFSGGASTGVGSLQLDVDDGLDGVVVVVTVTANDPATVEIGSPPLLDGGTFGPHAIPVRLGQLGVPVSLVAWATPTRGVVSLFSEPLDGTPGRLIGRTTGIAPGAADGTVTLQRSILVSASLAADDSDGIGLADEAAVPLLIAVFVPIEFSGARHGNLATLTARFGAPAAARLGKAYLRRRVGRRWVKVKRLAIRGSVASWTQVTDGKIYAVVFVPSNANRLIPSSVAFRLDRVGRSPAPRMPIHGRRLAVDLRAVAP